MNETERMRLAHVLRGELEWAAEFVSQSTSDPDFNASAWEAGYLRELLRGVVKKLEAA